MLSKNKDLGLLLLRITFGGLMIVNHGWRKLGKILDGNLGFADPIGIGATPSLYLTVGAEVVCAGLLILGLFTRWASIPLIITMLVAIFVVHWADPFADKEMAILYLIPYVVLYLMGPGQYSIDAKMGKA